MQERERKGFIHWDDPKDALVIGRAYIPFDLMMTSLLVLTVPTVIGVVSFFHGMGWLPLLAVPGILIFGSFMLYGIYRAVKSFVMQWVYVFAPWKRPKRRSEGYYY